MSFVSGWGALKGACLRPPSGLSERSCQDAPAVVSSLDGRWYTILRATGRRSGASVVTNAKAANAGVVWVRAAGLRLRLLDVLRADGLTLPWRAVYLRPSRFEDADLRAHELVHIEQIARDGALFFSVRYVWWLVRYGYAANPYEIEAYDRVPGWPGRRARLDRARKSAR
jgi:hypothetical protein